MDLDEEYVELARQRYQKHLLEFRDRFDLSKHPSMAKEKLPPSFVEKYFKMERAWKKGLPPKSYAILGIVIQPNFDPTTENGMVIWLNKDIKVPIELVSDDNMLLGICQTSYPVVGGTPSATKPAQKPKMWKQMARCLNGVGPIKAFRKEHDCVMAPGMCPHHRQHVTMAYNKTKGHFKIFSRMGALYLSNQLKEKMKEYHKDGVTLGDFMEKPDQDELLKTTLRNANRTAVDVARYLQSIIPMKEDKYAYQSDASTHKKPYLAIPDSVGMTNVFIHLKDFDLGKYKTHTHCMGVRPTIPLFDNVSPGKHGIAFCKGFIPQKYYATKQMMFPRILQPKLQNRKWRGFASDGIGEHITELEVHHDIQHSRYMGYPDTVSYKKENQYENSHCSHVS